MIHFGKFLITLFESEPNEYALSVWRGTLLWTLIRLIQLLDPKIPYIFFN